MPKTYQICEVTVMLPPLGTTTTDGCGNKNKHSAKCRVHLYAVKPDWRSGGIFVDGLIVGLFTHEGYSELPCKRSQKIMMPDGYKLVALSVDERGMPTSWDSLPVSFSGGYVSSLEDVDGTVRVRTGKINGTEPLTPAKPILSIEENDKEMSDFEEAIRKVIHKELLPGGLIWHQCRR